MAKRSKRCPATRRRRASTLRGKRAAKACLARRKPGRPSKAAAKVYRRAVKLLGGKSAACKYLASLHARRAGK